MSVKIRLRRVGAKKQPAYRIVIADSRAPRDGRFIEIVGAYNPLTHPATVTVDTERVCYWMGHGAQPTDVVKRLFERQDIKALFTGEAVPVTTEAPVEIVPAPEALPEPEAAPAEEAEVTPAPEAAPVEEAEAAPAETAPAEETPAE